MKPRTYRRPDPIAVLDRSGHCYYMAEGKNPAAVELGRFGGKKGGKARAEKLSAERRKEIARKAAKIRWDNKRRDEEPS
jgi:hypothetical protein